MTPGMLSPIRKLTWTNCKRLEEMVLTVHDGGVLNHNNEEDYAVSGFEVAEWLGTLPFISDKSYASLQSDWNSDEWDIISEDYYTYKLAIDYMKKGELYALLNEA